MTNRFSIPALVAALFASPAFSATIRADPAIDCSTCAAWNGPHEPFKVYGSTYYVGVAGLSSILIASGDGLILIDGGLPQSAPAIAAHVEKLGFQVSDIRLILNSHTHFDHAAGIAALQRASGAEVAASAASAKALESGGPMPNDPQYGLKGSRFPSVESVRVVGDGETLHVGPLAITAHYTPGHTPGGTTWTWQSCQDNVCEHMVYADSLNAVSGPSYRFSDEKAHPGVLGAFRKSIATVADLPCDILLAPHPDMIDMEGKLARLREHSGTNPFVDSGPARPTRHGPWPGWTSVWPKKTRSKAVGKDLIGCPKPVPAGKWREKLPLFRSPEIRR